MAKEVTAFVKLQLVAGKASPAPPVGPALGQHGINMMEFCKSFNSKTADKGDLIIPVVVSIYKDRSFSFILKTPPASVLIKRSLELEKGSSIPNRDKVGTLTQEQLAEIAQIKLPDLNTNNIDMAKRIVAGTARSMGVLVEE